MDQHNMYAYPYPQQRQRSPGPQSISRPSGAYQNSSAFSASANPDEDWTKISDLAERRRIQNRIAQRNYRKKLKRRLEDLEKRTTSSSASPEQVPQEMAKSSSGPMGQPIRNSNPRRASQNTMVSHESPYAPDFSNSGEYWSDMRQSSNPQYPFSYSTPSSQTFTTVAPTVDYFPTEYSSADYSQPMYTAAGCQPGYLQASSPPLPNMMNSHENSGEAHYHNGTGMMNTFDVNYASLTGSGIPIPQNATARTPPLTDSASQMSSSRECSPPFFGRPLTPDSQGMSPNIHLFSI